MNEETPERNQRVLVMFRVTSWIVPPPTKFSAPPRRSRRGRPELRSADRLRGVGRRVIKNPIAVVAGYHFRAAPYVGHYLRAQRHVARGAGAVASFGHGHPVAYARGDPFVERAGGFGKFTRQAFAFGQCDRDLLLLCL